MVKQQVVKGFFVSIVTSGVVQCTVSREDMIMSCSSCRPCDHVGAVRGCCVRVGWLQSKSKATDST